MDEKELLEKLCTYDKRSPYYYKEKGPRKQGCGCDNCFCGRHELANALLQAYKVIKVLQGVG